MCLSFRGLFKFLNLEVCLNFVLKLEVFFLILFLLKFIKFGLSVANYQQVFFPFLFWFSFRLPLTRLLTATSGLSFWSILMVFQQF